MRTDFSTATLEIDLAAVRANYNLLRKMGGVDSGAVVKANGYGLGAVQIARELYNEGCRHFFVATIDEAVELKRADVKGRIFVFEGVRQSSLNAFREFGVIPVLNDGSQIEQWNNFAAKNAEVMDAAIHYDTGMTRLGLTHAQFDSFINNKPQNINTVMLLSHLACADDPQHPLNQKQLVAFKAGAAKLPDVPASFANSSGVFLGQEYSFNLLRPGVALYGMNPTSLPDNPMHNVVTLRAEIVQLRTTEAAESIGYSATVNVEKGARLATVGCGYADGIPWQLAGKLVARLGDYSIPLLGRVTMDLMIFDVSHVPESMARNGAMVEIIGSHNTVDDIADSVNTISYEILTGFGRRLKRIYI